MQPNTETFLEKTCSIWPKAYSQDNTAVALGQPKPGLVVKTAHGSSQRLSIQSDGAPECHIPCLSFLVLGFLFLCILFRFMFWGPALCFLMFHCIHLILIFLWPCPRTWFVFPHVSLHSPHCLITCVYKPVCVSGSSPDCLASCLCLVLPRLISQFPCLPVPHPSPSFTPWSWSIPLTSQCSSTLLLLQASSPFLPSPPEWSPGSASHLCLTLWRKSYLDIK